MAALNRISPIIIDKEILKDWGTRWLSGIDEETKEEKAIESFNRKQSVNFASFIDLAFGNSISKMLGGIQIITPSNNSLLPAESDVVEVGSVRIVGGVRPQNFDAAYRPDGPRIVFDSKTLNEEKSIGKNWQNMINDK
ncbi:MAG: hypothetical protein JXB88_00380 [Spirochaetales bacterium]|nr:hypothetical protein [Spirochaetales bacterium]